MRFEENLKRIFLLSDARRHLHLKNLFKQFSMILGQHSILKKDVKKFSTQNPTFPINYLKTDQLI